MGSTTPELRALQAGGGKTPQRWRQTSILCGLTKTMSEGILTKFVLNTFWLLGGS